MLKFTRKAITATAAGLAIAWAGMTAHAAQHESDIVETAAKSGDFDTLIAAVTAAELVDALKATGPMTVFAPTDAAFAKLPPGTVEALLENKDKLRAILTYHVVPGEVMASEVITMRTAPTVLGQPLEIESGEGVRVGGANVVQTDIAASNGVIHVIDTVMMPKDIVEVAAEAGSFDTLLTAAQAADLVDVLKGDGPFTVFAPTDAAFAKLDPGTLNALLQPENKAKLQAVLTYHVLPQAILARDLPALSTAETVQGQSVDIDLRNQTLYVDGAKVTTTDIRTLNGIIHVIDTVILPEM